MKRLTQALSAMLLAGVFLVGLSFSASAQEQPDLNATSFDIAEKKDAELQEDDPRNRLQPQSLTGPSSVETGANTAEAPGFLLEASLVKHETFPINLETVLKLVADQNLRIAREEMSKKAVKARFYQSLADFLPDFNGQYDHRRFQGVVQLFGNDTLVIRQTVIEPGFLVSHRVYPGGKRIFDALVARKRVNAAKSLVKETYQEQLARAAEDYYILLGAQIGRDFALQSLKEAREQLALSEARFQAGLGTRLDVMQAKTQEAQRLRNVINANALIGKAEQVLLNRLNLDPDISLVPWKLDAEIRRLVPESIPSDTLVYTALENNPTLARLSEEVKALKWQARSVLSEVVPAVDLNYANTYRGPRIDQLGLTRAGGLSITTTLGNDLGAEIPLRWLESNRLTKQKQLEKKAAIRDLETRVINAHLDSLAFRSAIEAAREERAAAEESFRLAQGRFRAGVGINLDVIAAEASLSNARSQLVRSVVDFNRAQIQLLEALGKVSPQTIRNGITQTELREPETKPGSSPLPLTNQNRQGQEDDE